MGLRDITEYVCENPHGVVAIVYDVVIKPLSDITIKLHDPNSQYKKIMVSGTNRICNNEPIDEFFSNNNDGFYYLDNSSELSFNYKETHKGVDLEECSILLIHNGRIYGYYKDYDDGQNYYKIDIYCNTDMTVDDLINYLLL